MTRFNMFTEEELDAMESAFCNEGLTYLVDEIRRERRYKEKADKAECGESELPWYMEIFDTDKINKYMEWMKKERGDTE